MKIGDRIKQRREELGISVDEIAHRLGKHRATIYRYESNDIGTLPTNVLEPLAVVLQTTPAALMGWEDEKESGLDEQLSGIDFALSGELHDLTDEEKQDILDYVRFKKEQKKGK